MTLETSRHLNNNLYERLVSMFDATQFLALTQANPQTSATILVVVAIVAALTTLDIVAKFSDSEGGGK